MEKYKLLGNGYTNCYEMDIQIVEKWIYKL